MEKERLQSAYDGAAMVYARSQALAYMGKTVRSRRPTRSGTAGRPWGRGQAQQPLPHPDPAADHRSAPQARRQGLVRGACRLGGAMLGGSRNLGRFDSSSQGVRSRNSLACCRPQNVPRHASRAEGSAQGFPSRSERASSGATLWKPAAAKRRMQPVLIIGSASKSRKAYIVSYRTGALTKVTSNTDLS